MQQLKIQELEKLNKDFDRIKELNWDLSILLCMKVFNFAPSNYRDLLANKNVAHKLKSRVKDSISRISSISEDLAKDVIKYILKDFYWETEYTDDNYKLYPDMVDAYVEELDNKGIEWFDRSNEHYDQRMLSVLDRFMIYKKEK